MFRARLLTIPIITVTAASTYIIIPLPNEFLYAPSYFGEETKYVWENNFYDLINRQMIYSARSRSFDYTSKTTLAHTYGQLMVSSLVDKKILLKPVEE